MPVFIIRANKGGPGSGHHGHAGRPGQRGGGKASVNYVGLVAELDGALSDKDQRAIDKYTHGFETVNGWLRESGGRLGHIEDTATRNDIRALDTALSKAKPLDEDVVLYRGIEEISNTPYHGMKVGDTLVDNAYMSTSYDRSIAGGFVGSEGKMLKITVPKGSEGIAFLHGSEKEVLIMRSSSDYRYDRHIRITSITDDVVEVILEETP